MYPKKLLYYIFICK